MHVSTQELITKGFFYEEKKEKSPQIGDSCQLDDGTPGVLAEDSKNPGELVCVPERDKSQSSETMKSDLPKQFKAENERHGKAVGKTIDEFGKKCLAEKSAKENQDNGADNSETDKAIDEFKDALDSEHGTHLENCMKAIGEYYETMGREPNAEKSIDEFKSAIKAEHLKHVKCFDKAIDEFTKDFPPNGEEDAGKKAIDEFEKKSADELDRHEKAHSEILKEQTGEGEDDGKDEKAIVEEIQKSGRVISAKNKAKIESAIKALEEHHAEHGKSTDNVIAALKELIAPQGDEGEEPKPEEKSDEAPNSRSSTSGAGEKNMNELEAYLFVQRLVRQVKTASEGALRQINEKVKERRSVRS